MGFPRQCVSCGLNFTVPSRKKKGVYCSARCMGDGYATRYRGAANPKWRGGRIKMQDGRVAVYAPGHPGAVLFGGSHILEYRLVAEKITGRPLYGREVVHHINGDPSDNRLENLMVMTQSEHCSMEMFMRAGRRKATIKQIYEEGSL